MKTFFTIFSLTVLAIIEIMIGNLGIFFPILSLGIIYFLPNNNRLFMLILAVVAAIIIDIWIYHRIFPLNLLIYTALIFLQKPYRHIISKGLLVNSLFGGLIFIIEYLLFLGINFFSNFELITDVPLLLSTIVFSFVMGTIGIFLLLIILEAIAESLQLPRFLDSQSHVRNKTTLYSRGKQR